MSNVTDTEPVLNAATFILPDLERSLYIGNAFGLIIYGVLMYMAFHSIALLNANRDPAQRNVRLGYIWYTVIMLVLIAFALTANVLMGQLMWIDHRDFEGGPVGFFTVQQTAWWNILGSAADIVGDFMANGLLIYRCYMIWNRNWKIIVFPCLMYLASDGLALTSLIQSAMPESSIFAKQSVVFAVPWLAMTCALNVLVTSLIAGRILYLSRTVRGVLPREMTSAYAGVVAVLVESALPFTILGIIFAVLLGKGLVEDIAFAVIWGSFVAVSPQLIILRVAMGRGWTTATVSQFSGNPMFSADQYTLKAIGRNDGTSDRATGHTLQGYASEKSGSFAKVV